MEFFKTTGARIEVFCLEPALPADYAQSLTSNKQCTWKCMVGNLKKWKEGSLTKKVNINGRLIEFHAELIESNGNTHTIRFTWNNKEILFAQTLEQVRKTAREQGNCISEEQVKDAFAELDLSGEQLQMVFDYLLKHKIGIGQPMDPDEFLTDEEKDYLQEYLDEVAELPTYTDGEKLAFAMSAMAGEADAQQRLIEIHLADVAEIAKLYAGQGVLLEDLVGEGNLALSFGVTMLGSLEKPQEVEGMLGKMIMDAMEEYIAEHAENSKIDKRVEDKVNKVADKARELAEELQRKVTIEELMEETGMSRKMIEDAVRMSGFKIEDIDNNAKDSL
jgi:RNA polymerase primary sigma factor